MELYLIGFFVLLVFLILIFNRYKKESSVRYYDKLRWQFDKRDAETVDVVEVTKAENGIEEEEEPESDYGFNGTQSLMSLVLFLVMFAMILGVGTTVLGQFQDAAGTAVNVTSGSIEAMYSVFSWMLLLLLELY